MAVCLEDTVRVVKAEAQSLHRPDVASASWSVVAGWPWLGSQGQGEGGWWVKEAEGRQAPLPSPAGWVWGGDKSSRRWSHGFTCPGIYRIFKTHFSWCFQFKGRLG